MAATLYWTAIIAIGCLLVAAGVADLTLFLCGKETISDYLREDPWRFWGPAVLTVVFLGVLAVHLFLEP